MVVVGRYLYWIHTTFFYLIIGPVSDVYRRAATYAGLLQYSLGTSRFYWGESFAVPESSYKSDGDFQVCVLPVGLLNSCPPSFEVAKSSKGQPI